MGPLDPRLVRRSRAARRFLVLGVLLAAVQAAATIALAYALAVLVAGLVGEAAVLPPGAIVPAVPDWARAEDPAAAGWMLAAAAVVRAAAGWCWEAVGQAGAARVKAELRGELLEALAAGRGGRGRGAPGTGRVANLLGNGLDALDDYVARFLPQLLLTAIATPALVLAAWLADPITGVILVVVLPVIPLFMALIGLATRAVQSRQWAELGRLASAFLELVGGLGTLKLYGRQHRQLARLRELTDRYRARTMQVLRVTFLSGFVLELAASLSVAIVAVTVGFRLVDGALALAVGLFVLVLAPEVFLPLRAVGAAFHASAAGVEAAADALDVLEQAPAGTRPMPETWSAVRGGTPARPGERGLRARLSVVRGGTVVVRDVELRAERGELTVLTGPSGSGKSSILAALLGFAEHEGSVRLDGAPLDRGALAWSGQRPTLLPGSIASNVRLGDPDADPARLDQALRLAAVGLPPERRIGARETLSGGQAQRVATARAIHRMLVRDTPVLLLDEPSSALDAALEAKLIDALRGIAEAGRIVLVASHRPAFAAAADRVLALDAPRHHGPAEDAADPVDRPAGRPAATGGRR